MTLQDHLVSAVIQVILFAIGIWITVGKPRDKVGILFPFVPLALSLTAIALFWILPVISFIAGPLAIGLCLQATQHKIRARRSVIWISIFALIVASGRTGINVFVAVLLKRIFPTPDEPIPESLWMQLGG